MERNENSESLVAPVKRETYEDQIDLRLPLDHLEPGESAILRHKNKSGNPYGWDVFTNILDKAKDPKSKLTKVTVEFHSNKHPQGGRLFVQNDGIVMLLRGIRAEPYGYFLADMQYFDTDVADLIEKTEFQRAKQQLEVPDLPI